MHRAFSSHAVPDNIIDSGLRNLENHTTWLLNIFSYIGALVTTVVLMGPKCFVKVSENYQEPTGTGKESSIHA